VVMREASYEKPMEKHQFVLAFAALTLLLFLVSAPVSRLWGGTIYEYRDEKGNMVLTDQPPPGGKGARAIESYREMTPEERNSLDTEKREKAEERETQRILAQEKARKQEEAERKKEEERRRAQEATGPPPSEWDRRVDEYLRAKGYRQNAETRRYQKENGETQSPEKAP
jgi:hypothetical protein